MASASGDVDVKALPKNLQFVADADMPGLLTVSARTWDRMKQAGDCPIKTRISQWRIAYRSDHIEQWLNTKVSDGDWQTVGAASQRAVESCGAGASARGAIDTIKSNKGE
jgi:hypothetical protein